MVSTRRKHYNPPSSPPPDRSDPHILRTLIGFLSPQSLKPPLLKSLYRLLLVLSSKTTLCCSNSGVASQSFDVKFHQFSFNIEFKEICDLSDILFKELHLRFKQLLSPLHGESGSQVYGQSGLYSEMLETSEQLTLLLRCCMVILDLLVSDQNLLVEKCKVLLSILRRICSLNKTGEMEENSMSFKKSVSRDCININSGCTTSIIEDFVASLSFIESSDSCRPFLSTMLEVFADELLAHKPLRKYFFLIDYFSSTSEMLFICHPSHSVMGSVIEVIAAHFLTFFSNEQSFETFLSRSFWQHDMDCRIPELSLSAGLSLLLNPIMLSAPKILQAHVILLVSEAIGIDMASGSLRPDQGLMDCYLSAFEKSAILYARNMSCLQMNGHPVGAPNYSAESYLYGRSFQQSFESYIRPVTRTKINRLITKFESSWHSSISNMYFRTKAELVSASIAYIKESQDILDEIGKGEILSMLQVIILEASGDNTLLHTNRPTSPQDLCLLASILKLMSSSLLQVLWGLRRSGNMDCLKSSKDLSSCREYATIVSIISSCFQEFKVHLPIQEILSDAVGIHPMRHKHSKLMLFHFSSLLSLSFFSGLEFLMKGCLYSIMLSLKLFIFEEGNVNALRSLLGSKLKSCSSQLFPEDILEAQVNKKSSQTVASKFQKIQTMYLSLDLLANECTRDQEVQAKILGNDLIKTNMEKSIVGTLEKTEETCSGRIFLKCRLEREDEPSDFDELADFIECKQGRDYSCWLKNRRRYRKFKTDKLAVFSWRKRKRTWKYMRGKRT